MSKHAAPATDEILAELLLLFQRELPAQINSIKAACAARDWHLLEELLHKLKGAAAVCRSDELCNRIEEARNAIKMASIRSAEEALAAVYEEAARLVAA